MVFVSLIIVAGDDFSVNVVDVTVPVVELVALEVSIIEIWLIGAAELASICFKIVVILVEDELCVSLKIFDLLIGAGVELAQIMAVLVVDVVDLAADVITDDGDS